MGFLADTPKPPYYAVIFSSIKGKYDEEYEHTAERMMNLAGGQPSFLGAESVREENGCGITVSYWDSLEAIKRWKDHTDHQAAKQKGKTAWYEAYAVRITKTESQRMFASKGAED
ncbi:antibiotic biosynthesis monooxygenase [Bacillus amyloliquefaciens]|uniref:antibiotic biosynthesis monooxygenase family protein n=1 Tax=Bacillus amyloliquefaciens TaxID=1390 RepID=UPI0010AD0496|nr:antibiotic biosynthesis monooxygenase [Bacillus amyloliquefaciens]TJZ68331.1 antibiotic biosynthesis monooxygenase [Bacillus amyloliquefaciens]